MTAPGGPLDSPGERDAVRLVLVRHAESEANIGGRWQGQGDSPLSERGKSQARALAERIARVGLQPDLVVCSDLRRASETARAAFGDAVEVDPLWREIDVGQWEGKTRAEVLMAIWDCFKAAGISIPYPQRDLYVRSWPGAVMVWGGSMCNCVARRSLLPPGIRRT